MEFTASYPPIFDLAFAQLDHVEEGAEAQAQLPGVPLVEQHAAEEVAGAHQPHQHDAGVQAALQQLSGAEVDNIAATRSLTRLQRAAHLQGALSFLSERDQWWKSYLLMTAGVARRGEPDGEALTLHILCGQAAGAKGGAGDWELALFPSAGPLRQLHSRVLRPLQRSVAVRQRMGKLRLLGNGGLPKFIAAFQCFDCLCGVGESDAASDSVPF